VAASSTTLAQPHRALAEATREGGQDVATLRNKPTRAVARVPMWSNPPRTALFESIMRCNAGVLDARGMRATSPR
jgi:hypothetical protein